MQAVVNPAQPRFKAEKPLVERIYLAVVIIEPVSHFTSKSGDPSVQLILFSGELILLGGNLVFVCVKLWRGWRVSRPSAS